MLLFDIKRYAVNDGPGIRTTLFMKGCPLRCVWCHNPESWSAHPQRLYKQSKCIGCHTCVDVCPQGALQLTKDGIRPVDGAECLLCGRCTTECPTTALEMCGREWTLDELMAEVEKERDIMTDSGGGVTLCGGEPLSHGHTNGEEMHPAIRILKELGRRGFHRAVDTTLYAAPELVMSAADECELMMVDLKLMDSARHRRWTGVGNELILENLRQVAESGIVELWIRIPLIEGVNTDEANIQATGQFLQSLGMGAQQSLGMGHVNLLPYHDVGCDKHRRMWSVYNPQQLPMSTPTDGTLDRCRRQLESYGLRVFIGG